MHDEVYHLVYTELGDDIKDSNFQRLLYHLNRTLLNLMQATHAHWDDEIGVQQIRWGTHDYWFHLDNIVDYYNGLTYHWLQMLFGLMDWCYKRGQIREFESKLYFGSRKLARVRVYFDRGDGVLE